MAAEGGDLTHASLHSRKILRYLAAFLTIAALAGFGWVFSLPDKAECAASGRVVDPTERHCESATGYQQLEEHALFHSREVVLGGLVILVGGYAIGRYSRRRSNATAPTA